MNKLIISQPLSFDNTNIRSTIHEGKTYYSVVDVISALIKDDAFINQNPSSYWTKLKKNQLKGSLPIWLRCDLIRSNGLSYPTDCSTREQMFEIDKISY